MTKHLENPFNLFDLHILSIRRSGTEYVTTFCLTPKPGVKLIEINGQEHRAISSEFQFKLKGEPRNDIKD